MASDKEIVEGYAFFTFTTTEKSQQNYLIDVAGGNYQVEIFSTNNFTEENLAYSNIGPNDQVSLEGLTQYYIAIGDSGLNVQDVASHAYTISMICREGLLLHEQKCVKDCSSIRSDDGANGISTTECACKEGYLWNTGRG